MSHPAPTPADRRPAPSPLDHLRARYAARADELRRLAARVDGAAMCAEFVAALDALQGIPAIAPTPATTSTELDRPSPQLERRAADRSRVAYRSKKRREVHLARLSDASPDVASVAPVVPGPDAGYDPHADARGFAVSLRAKKGGTR